MGQHDGQNTDKNPHFPSFLLVYLTSELSVTLLVKTRKVFSQNTTSCSSKHGLLEVCFQASESCTSETFTLISFPSKNPGFKLK